MALSRYYSIPVLRPTVDELNDLSRFLEKHMPEFREAGLIKIVPPANWATNLPTERAVENLQVTRPIKQELKGRQGLWETTNLEQRTMSVPEFRKLAEVQGREAADKSPFELERIFWKNMGRFPATYGADNPGSLFESSGCSWTFDKIDSILTHLDRELPGINSAYLYFGMWKALFAWHSEDLELFSINYVHFGAAKEWYCIRPKDKPRFDTVASSLFPAQANSCSQFLRHKMTIISPAVLHSYGFEIGHVVQNAGEFVVTFPAAYHMGFNHGWNCAESVNFALPCWMEYGKRARVCRCQPDSVRFDVLALERRWLEATKQIPKSTAPLEVWSFTCRCRPDWTGTDKDVQHPIGHLFQCSGCSLWSHVDCYPRYADRDPVDLPLQMYCHKCRPLPVSKRMRAESQEVKQETSKQSPEKQLQEAPTTARKRGRAPKRPPVALPLPPPPPAPPQPVIPPPLPQPVTPPPPPSLASLPAFAPAPIATLPSAALTRLDATTPLPPSIASPVILRAPDSFPFSPRLAPLPLPAELICPSTPLPPSFAAPPLFSVLPAIEELLPPIGDTGLWSLDLIPHHSFSTFPNVRYHTHQ